MKLIESEHIDHIPFGETDIKRFFVSPYPGAEFLPFKFVRALTASVNIEAEDDNVPQGIVCSAMAANPYEVFGTVNFSKMKRSAWDNEFTDIDEWEKECRKKNYTYIKTRLTFSSGCLLDIRMMYGNTVIEILSNRSDFAYDELIMKALADCFSKKKKDVKLPALVKVNEEMDNEIQLTIYVVYSTTKISYPIMLANIAKNQQIKTACFIVGPKGNDAIQSARFAIPEENAAVADEWARKCLDYDYNEIKLAYISVSQHMAEFDIRCNGTVVTVSALPEDTDIIAQIIQDGIEAAAKPKELK